jgi:hypothetical protein
LANRIVSLIFILPLPALLGAQSSAPSAVVTGVAIDSVRGGYLRNATVTLTGTARRVTTDSSGRFLIDGLPDGNYSFRLSHPILDTLGIGVVTQQFRFKAGDTTHLILSVPSPGTIVHRKCSAAQIKQGDAALIGTVTYADSDVPPPGAGVVVAWTDFAFGKTSVAKTPQRRTATVRADGSYIVCGVPRDLQTGIIAFSGADSTSEVPVSFANGLVIRALHLPLPVTSHVDSAEIKVNRAVVSGKITDEKGAAIQGARVAVDADNAVTTSASDGTFRLAGVRSGTRSMSVKKLGFAATDAVLEVSMQRVNETTVKLAVATQVLPTVNVSAVRDVGLQRVGYTERKRTTTGVFFGQREIEGKNSPSLSKIIETVPFFRDGRYTCIRYWVDGHMWSTASDMDANEGPDAFLSGAEIAAVEVYSPLYAPAEFIVSSKYGACASVVIWTKAKLGL